VTNGLATVAYVNSATNGFVTAGVTNGLATVAYVNSATNGFVTASVTNGLATTAYVTGQGYVTSTVTNGLATTAYVLSSGTGITNDIADTSNLAVNAAVVQATNEAANASNLSSGTVPLARLGNANTNAYAPGSNITLTTNAGVITIASGGGSGGPVNAATNLAVGGTGTIYLPQNNIVTVSNTLNVVSGPFSYNGVAQGESVINLFRRQTNGVEANSAQASINFFGLGVTPDTAIAQNTNRVQIATDNGTQSPFLALYDAVQGIDSVKYYWDARSGLGGRWAFGGTDAGLSYYINGYDAVAMQNRSSLIYSLHWTSISNGFYVEGNFDSGAHAMDGFTTKGRANGNFMNWLTYDASVSHYHNWRWGSTNNTFGLFYDDSGANDPSKPGQELFRFDGANSKIWTTIPMLVSNDVTITGDLNANQEVADSLIISSVVGIRGIRVLNANQELFATNPFYASGFPTNELNGWCYWNPTVICFDVDETPCVGAYTNATTGRFFYASSTGSWVGTTTTNQMVVNGNPAVIIDGPDPTTISPASVWKNPVGGPNFYQAVCSFPVQLFSTDGVPIYAHLTNHIVTWTDQ